MSMYAIKDTTLTALGDAVRSKTGRIVEEINDFFIDNISYSTITSNNSAPKYRFIINSNEDINSNEGLRVYEGNVSGPMLFGSYLENGVLPLTIETTNPTLVFTMFASNGRTFNITIIPLDENGNEFKYTPLEMVDAINGLMTIPDGALNITGNCQYKFAYNGSNWLIEECGNKITTNGITDASYMFYGNKELSEIPFEINIGKNVKIENIFSLCEHLIYAPKVNMEDLTTHISFVSVFSNCKYLKEIPEWLIDLLEKDYNLSTKNSIFGPWNHLFDNCYSIRKIPDRAMKSIRNDNMTGNYYGLCYSKPFTYMRCLDELVGIHCDNYNYTSNQFSYFFNGLCRVKDITFATNDDGTPVIRPWKSQTIDMTNNIGYTSYSFQITAESNTGITADKEVKDDATYQALKNDPDWFSCDINYSRYNHDSAVNTINSLPDCSATGTNTIKFKGQAGALTDGGAINTLTEEEIAVATAKGWVVSFV